MAEATTEDDDDDETAEPAPKKEGRQKGGKGGKQKKGSGGVPKAIGAAVATGFAAAGIGGKESLTTRLTQAVIPRAIRAAAPHIVRALPLSWVVAAKELGIAKILPIIGIGVTAFLDSLNLVSERNEDYATDLLADVEREFMRRADELGDEGGTKTQVPAADVEIAKREVALAAIDDFVLCEDRVFHKRDPHLPVARAEKRGKGGQITQAAVVHQHYTAAEVEAFGLVWHDDAKCRAVVERDLERITTLKQEITGMRDRDFDAWLRSDEGRTLERVLRANLSAVELASGNVSLPDRTVTFRGGIIACLRQSGFEPVTDFPMLVERGITKIQLTERLVAIRDRSQQPAAPPADFQQTVQRGLAIARDVGSGLGDVAKKVNDRMGFEDGLNRAARTMDGWAARIRGGGGQGQGGQP